MKVWIGAVLVVFLASFQLFFRYEHWNSARQDGMVFERDRLTGETHIIEPGEKISFLARLMGNYGAPAQEAYHHNRNNSKTKSSSPHGTTSKNRPNHPVDSEAGVVTTARVYEAVTGRPGNATYQMNMTEVSQPDTQQKLRINRIETDDFEVGLQQSNNPQNAQPRRHLERRGYPPYTVQQNLPPSANFANHPSHTGLPGSHRASMASQPMGHSPYAEVSNQTISRQFDLNGDGVPEQIIQRTQPHTGLLEISIVNQGREIFYGTGRQLQILPSRRLGWLDLALITPAHPNSTNPLKTVYHYSPKSDAYLQ